MVINQISCAHHAKQFDNSYLLNLRMLYIISYQKNDYLGHISFMFEFIWTMKIDFYSLSHAIWIETIKLIITTYKTMEWIECMNGIFWLSFLVSNNYHRNKPSSTVVWMIMSVSRSTAIRIQLTNSYWWSKWWQNL